MDEKLEAWIDECIGKGTFKNRDDAIEFCVGATKMFCEEFGYTQENMIENDAASKKLIEKGEMNPDHFIETKFPLKYSEYLGKMIEKTHQESAKRIAREKVMKNDQSM